jgi:hypothetical protein
MVISYCHCHFQVWGGGLWYHDAVYDAADEMGLLMYHDAMYGQPWFGGNSGVALDNAMQEAEIRYQLRRLSHHPCLALLDACNEVRCHRHSRYCRRCYCHVQNLCARAPARRPSAVSMTLTLYSVSSYLGPRVFSSHVSPLATKRLLYTGRRLNNVYVRIILDYTHDN